MHSVLSVILLTLALLITPLAAFAQDAPAIPDEELAKIRAAAPEQPAAKPSQPRRLLVYTDCKGFRHTAIPYGSATLRILGERSGAFEVQLADEPSVFAADKLKRFDAVCFNNTTGTLFDDPALKESLLSFVRAGGGLVGIHAATDCFYEWPEFGELMGGYFDGHPWNEEVALKIDEPGHPLVSMFNAPFKIADEIYQFRAPYSRARLRVLLSLDTTATDMTKKGIKRDDGDFAVSWVRNYGRGRVFYCSLGHRHDIFWNSKVLEHYLAGIQFALGDLPALATPTAWNTGSGAVDLLAGGLSGWICKPGAWVVEDGVLSRKGGSYVWTEQEYGDFMLELEFKVAPKANSGIFFRTGDIDDPVQTGIELQVLDSYGQEPDKHSCGAIYDCLAPKVNAARPAGEWNQLRLTCRGPHITATLNGADIIDMSLDEWTTPQQNPDGTPNKFKTAYQNMPRRGRIGFQDHGDAVWYRNIRVSPLAGQ